MTRTRTGVSGVLAVTMIALVIAGCGGTVTPTTAPSAPASQTGALGRLSDLKSYLEQVKPITSDLAATVSSMPDAVKGISAKPDGSWTTAAGKLDDIAAQLGDEADNLAALTPPDGLRSLQEVTVNGIQAAQSAVTKLADALSKRTVTSATRQSEIESAIGKLRAQLSALGMMLSAGIDGLTGSSSTTPSP
jgi:hypothetical protein